MPPALRFVAAACALAAVTLAPAVHAEPDKATAVVIAEGVGKDEKEAKKAAFRDAVSRVVGTLIDAETLVKNDEVISERILEYSGGFVKSYDVLKSEKTAGGLVRVRISATVERLQLVGKLADAKIAVKEVRGGDLLAEKMTKEEAKKNATELLAKLHAELPKILRAEAKGAPQLTDTRDGLYVDTVISADMKAYDAYVKKATALLDKIALAKDTGLVSGKKSRLGVMEYDKPEFHDLPKLGQNTPKGYAIWMMTHIDGAGSKMRWKYYWVDADMAATLKPIAGEVRLHIEFNDNDGKLVAEDEVLLYRTDAFDSGRYYESRTVMPRFTWLLWNYSERKYIVDGENRITCNLYIAPLVNQLNPYEQRDYRLTLPYRHKVKLTDDELGRIKSVKTSVRLHAGELGKRR